MHTVTQAIDQAARSHPSASPFKNSPITVQSITTLTTSAKFKPRIATMTPTTLTNHRHTPHPQHKAHQTQLTLPRTLIGRVPRVATKSIQNKNPGRGGTENRCFIWHRRDKDVWLTSTDKIPAHRVDRHHRCCE